MNTISTKEVQRRALLNVARLSESCFSGEATRRVVLHYFFSQSVAQSAWPLPHPPTFDLAHQRNSSVDCSRFPSGAKLSRATAARGIGPRRPHFQVHRVESLRNRGVKPRSGERSYVH